MILSIFILIYLYETYNIHTWIKVLNNQHDITGKFCTTNRTSNMMHKYYCESENKDSVTYLSLLKIQKDDRVTRDMEKEEKIDLDKLSLILFNTSKTSDDWNERYLYKCIPAQSLYFFDFLVFLGPLTNDQSTEMLCPRISPLFNSSLAFSASLYVSYSTRA